MERYECPNGHAIAPLKVVNCTSCGSAIAYEPAAKGMAMAEQLQGAVEAAAELAQALRLTQEYIGNEALPPIEGWSWFDALSKHGHYEGRRSV